ncbi:MAG TPA: flagellar biosynthesis anti-sigma factor FlgM [Ktedonobacteraceae bacterium]|nr:flagellar biosynthesis anti-sigma factor FlgM [Ktedonobacteraceae bacterium]
MKARTDLSLAVTTRRTKGTRQVQQSEKAVTAWEKRITSQEEPSAVRSGVQAAKRNSAEQSERAARVESLRAQVKAGTYQVDSRLLAEKLLFSDEDTRDEAPKN